MGVGNRSLGNSHNGSCAFDASDIHCVQGELPYKDIHFLQVMRYVQSGYRLEQPELASDELFKVISKCWERKPEKRFTMNDLGSKLKKVYDKVKEPEMRDFGATVSGVVASNA